MRDAITADAIFGTVAYVLTPSAAKALLEFYEKEMSRPNPGEYRLWETYVGVFLRKQKGILNYLPVYSYVIWRTWRLTKLKNTREE